MRPQGAAFPRRFARKAEQRFPENVKWLRFLRVALRNEALSRSKKHDAGSSEFWQVYFHRSGGGGGGNGTRCPRTVTAFAEVSSRRHQIGPFDAIRHFFCRGPSPWSPLGGRSRDSGPVTASLTFRLSCFFKNTSPCRTGLRLPCDVRSANEELYHRAFAKPPHPVSRLFGRSFHFLQISLRIALFAHLA